MKQAILDLLQELKDLGKDRRTIETELKYSPNYIDQALSKGGNKRFYEALLRYRDVVTEQLKDIYMRGMVDPKATEVKEKGEEYAGFWGQIPEYRHCDYATLARGDAMQPLIRNNAIVGGKMLNDPDLIVFGEIYIVQTRNGMEVIRYLQPGADPASLRLGGRRGE